jgi:hypothetical protein
MALLVLVVEDSELLLLAALLLATEVEAIKKAMLVALVAQ